MIQNNRITPASGLGRRLLGLSLAVLVVGLGACAPGETETDVADATQYLEIMDTPPHDLPRTASQEELAKFAWQEFLALHWKSSFDEDGRRGTPSSTWNYSTPGAYPQLLVWQTYAQTTELRPNGPLTVPWDQLGLPRYSYKDTLRRGSPSAQLDLWNNLDEDNEIGSCNIYGQYAAQPSPKELVLYQVKVNKDEYEYVRQNFGAGQQDPQGALGQVQNLVKAYLASPENTNHAYFPNATNNCDCGPTGGQRAICLPCGDSNSSVEGAIEVKSAWRRLLPSEDASRYYTTTAQFYDDDGEGNLAYYNDTFALIGIHIIHKTRNYPDFVFATFEHVDVEQSDMQFILLSPPPTTVPAGTEQGHAVPVVRQSGQANRTQNHPVPPTLDEVTNQVHAQLKGLNPAIIWQNYRLTGVQGRSVEGLQITGVPAGQGQTMTCISRQDPIKATNKDPNYFMANFVIESDPFLNNFSGPGFGTNPFTDCNNTIYNNTLFNNGGCKGCHGVAQTSFGTDFSFLLDFGQNKPAIRPATLHYDPPRSKASKPSALKNYLK